MNEKEVESYLIWHVARLGGRTYKFRSPSQRGVADRIVCLRGQTWFVELKTKGGRLSELQKLFAWDMEFLQQRYACLWNKEMIDKWVSEL